MKWKNPIVYTAVGAVLGSTLMAATPVLANSTFKTFVASLVQNGQQVANPSAIAYHGTSYFGIWWLQQQLAKDGIHVTWDGKVLNLTDMPVQQTSTLSASNPSGTTASTPLLAHTIIVNGVTYVPLSSVQQLLAAMGSKLELKADRNQGQGNSSSTTSSASALQGVAGRLNDVATRLSTVVNTPQSGGMSGTQVIGIFTESLVQLQAAIGQLGQLSSTGTWSTSGNATGNDTNTSTSQSVLAVLKPIIASLQADYQSLKAMAPAAAPLGGGILVTASGNATGPGIMHPGANAANQTGSTQSGSVGFGVTLSSPDITTLKAIIADLQKQAGVLASIAAASH